MGNCGYSSYSNLVACRRSSVVRNACCDKTSHALEPSKSCRCRGMRSVVVVYRAGSDTVVSARRTALEDGPRCSLHPPRVTGDGVARQSLLIVGFRPLPFVKPTPAGMT